MSSVHRETTLSSERLSRSEIQPAAVSSRVALSDIVEKEDSRL